MKVGDGIPYHFLNPSNLLHANVTERSGDDVGGKTKVALGNRLDTRVLVAERSCGDQINKRSSTGPKLSHTNEHNRVAKFVLLVVD